MTKRLRCACCGDPTALKWCEECTEMIAEITLRNKNLFTLEKELKDNENIPMKQVRIGKDLITLTKGDFLKGRRSEKVFEVLSYENSIWGYTVYTLMSSDGETRRVASFLIGKKYILLDKK